MGLRSGGALSTEARVLSPVSTSAESTPASTAIAMSVCMRSPTMMQSCGETPSTFIAVSSMIRSGLPTLTSQATPELAVIAAVMAAASGSPRPFGIGQ